MSAAWERAVREVGDWIRGERREFAANRVESKSLNSLVSYVDRDQRYRFCSKQYERAFKLVNKNAPGVTAS